MSTVLAQSADPAATVMAASPVGVLSKIVSATCPASAAEPPPVMSSWSKSGPRQCSSSVMTVVPAVKVLAAA